MGCLSAVQAVAIAEAVYTVEDNSINEALKISNTKLGLFEDFKIATKGGFKGKSGVLLLKSKTGFGYIAEGQGRRQGEVLIAIRGTGNVQDVATDLNQGIQIGPGGWPVHAGFNDTFNSFKHELRNYFSKNNPTHVHCVGHSLGGALATLTAGFIAENKISEASLYTFGSPRTGALGFSRQLTQRMKAQNIYRAHHIADPISMIPLFPFSHVPVSSTDVLMPWSGGSISPSAHFMDNYIHSIGETSWDGLRNYSSAMENRDDIAKWLQSAASQNMFMHSAELLWMLSKALQWLIKKIAGGVIGTGLVMGMTVVDQLAWMLTQGTLASLEISMFVESLMTRILHFLGKSVAMVGKMTVSFVRWVLSMLFKTILNFASISLSMTGKNM